jgi:hypothetical protein
MIDPPVSSPLSSPTQSNRPRGLSVTPALSTIGASTTPTAALNGLTNSSSSLSEPAMMNTSRSTQDQSHLDIKPLSDENEDFNSTNRNDRKDSVAASSGMDLRASVLANASVLTGLSGRKETIAITPLLNKETFETKAERIRRESPYGNLTNWKVVGLIAKSNDDVRQEVY